MNLSRKDFLLRSTAVVLPFSLAASVRRAEENWDRPSAPGRSQFNVRLFGAKGDGIAKDTQAVQAAIDAAGVLGGSVYFPPGKYLSGTVRLQSHVSLFLDSGATLIASPDKADFDPYETLDFKFSTACRPTGCFAAMPRRSCWTTSTSTWRKPMPGRP